MPVSPDEDRKRGRIEERGANLRVVVYAGMDPVTGRRAYLRETVKGNDKAARRQANKVMTRLLAEVDKQRATESSIPLAHVIDEWLRVAELEDGTREMYRGYLNRNIRPVLGDIPARKLTARDLETFYAVLRRCRTRCDGNPFVEHKTEDEHDCKAEKCAPHECNPLAVSTVRQIHSVISGAMSAAVRWEWVSTNPAKVAQRPRQTPPEPKPPTPAEARMLIDAAFDKDREWGTLVWLVMTTGMRRGEVAALTWSNVDLEEGMIEVRRNFVKRDGVEKIKATKTHQMRRVALDTETVVLLAEQKTRVQDRCAEAGIDFDEEKIYVFTGARNARHVDLAVIDLLREQLDALRRLDRQMGAVVAYGEVREKDEQVRQLHSYSLTPHIRVELAHLLAELSALAGWEALDQYAISQAWEHHELAKRAAREADSVGLLAHATAQQALVLADLGEVSPALQQLVQARSLVERVAPSLLRAWLAAAYGEGLAAAGCRDEALRAFDEAGTLLPADPVDPSLPFLFLAGAHLDRWRGHALAQLGDVEAIDVLTNALQRLDPTFTRAETTLRVDLARALIKNGCPADAHRHTQHAEHLATKIGSARQRRRLQSLTSSAVVTAARRPVQRQLQLREQP